MKELLVVLLSCMWAFNSLSVADEPTVDAGQSGGTSVFATLRSNDELRLPSDSQDSELSGSLQADQSSKWYAQDNSSAADDSLPVSRTRLAFLKPISFDSLATNVSTDPNGATYSLLPNSCGNDPACWRPLDTLSLFGGLEGSKQPQDFGVNANFGSRWAANWGFPLLAEYGIGAQIGSSINQTDNAVQVFDRVGATSQRTQNFSTVGIFQRYDRWRWGVGYDFLYESYYDQFFLGQWRGRGGYAVTNKDEVGVWYTISQHHDSGMFLTIPVTLTPLDQGNVYWQHQFDAGTRTMVWAGVAEGHGQVNLALGDLKKTGDVFVFGAEIDVPLNRYLAIYGQANFISPADSGTVDSYLGVAFYPGGHAFPVSRSPFAPLLALANNTMFATDLHR